MNAYLDNLPAEVVKLSARISDRVLLSSFETVDTARLARHSEPFNLPGFGTVAPSHVSIVWSWLVDLVKSRHVDEWTAVSDAHFARIEADAARLQSVTVDAIDWDSVPDELFDTKSSALDIAVTVLKSHVQGVTR